jgi:hypothetical protein
MGNAPARVRNAGEKKLKDAGQVDSPDGQTVSSGENVDKIRDILFGSQIREYERSLRRMSSRMSDASLVRRNSN